MYIKKLIILLISILFLFSCSSETKLGNNENKMKVFASIVPIASITNYIGGDYVEADSIVPAGVSPHGFDLKASDMKKISDSQMVFYLGLDHIDSFLDKILNNNKKTIVYTGSLIISGDNHEKHTGDSHEGHFGDPHVWTSSKNAKMIALIIKERLSLLLPEREKYFNENYNNFVNEISGYFNEYKNDTIGKKEKDFIIFHDAYNYLFEELGIDEDKKIVFQKSLSTDINAKELKELTDIVLENNVKIFFKEPQFSNSSINEFAIKNNMEIFNLDPLGTDISSLGYIKNYKNNLDNLKNINE